MKILLVGMDIEKFLKIIAMIRGIIRGCFFEFSRSDTVFEFLEKGKPDIVIADFDLGNAGFSGLDVAQKAKEENPECTSILISNLDLECLGDIHEMRIYQLPERFSQEKIKTIIDEIMKDRKFNSFLMLAGTREEDAYR